VLRERKQNDRIRVPVDISIEYAWNLFIYQDKTCKLSGLPISIGNKPCSNTASIDRIDSSLGYIEGNIQWIHKHVNFMKRTYSNEYFIEMCTKIANQNKKKDVV
jgi:hypothetical protein